MCRKEEGWREEGIQHRKGWRENSLPFGLNVPSSRVRVGERRGRRQRKKQPGTQLQQTPLCFPEKLIVLCSLVRCVPVTTKRYTCMPPRVRSLVPLFCSPGCLLLLLLLVLLLLLFNWWDFWMCVLVCSLHRSIKHPPSTTTTKLGTT